MSERMWMVRGEGGSLYDAFRERGLVAVGWKQLAPHARPGVTRQQLIEAYLREEPTARQGTAVASASQVWRFVNEIREGDEVVTYSPSNRVYLVGTITGEAEYHPEWEGIGLPLTRSVRWRDQELQRDLLSLATRNSLGSTLTVFELSATAAQEVREVMSGRTLLPNDAETLPEAELIDPLANIETLTLERVKDLVSQLGWDEMQELVAGILRAMGYKTQVSPAGSDRGKDIIASPDGFGFEHPRIVVEVKHRKGQMGSQDIRSFLGGRHKDDRGLYVSTGGFTKDALYEAERASIPLVMWTLEHLVRTLMEHYDATDAETKRLVPLKRLYWPA